MEENNTENKPKRPALHPEVEKYLKTIPAMVATAKANSKRFEFLDKLKADFSDCYSYASAYAPCESWEVSFQFETFAQAKRVLKTMAEAGIRRQGKVYKDASSGLMRWDFKGWIIRGYFNSKKETACRYVQTGTKTVEVPIMELQCDEVIDPVFAATVQEVDGEELPF